MNASKWSHGDRFRFHTLQARYAAFMSLTEANDVATFAANDDAASDRRTQVLFAAMVGAYFLAGAVGDAEWIRSLKSAVEDEAVRRN